MSDAPEKFRFIPCRVGDRRELFAKRNGMSRPLRGSRELRRLWELTERDELQQHLERFEFKGDFPKYFN